MSKHIATLTLFRFDPEKDLEPRFVTYQIPVTGAMSVLQALRYTYRHVDGSLAFRDSDCRRGVCGLCAMVVNKKRGLACLRKAEKDMVVEPLPNRKVVRDLVIEFD